MIETKLNFGAITIDNDIFKSEGYRFYEGMLFQLRQFKLSPVIVLQTDIVHSEAIKHIGEEISKARSSIERALRSANKQLMINEGDIDNARNLLSVANHENEIAESRLIKYYEFIGAEIIDSAEYADISVLLSKYFETEAPFETGKDKKNEFPDAIALLSLEGWAEKNDINVLAVSYDKGWKNYTKYSKRITLVSSLSEALEKFQPHTKVVNIIAQIREDSLLDEPNHVLEEIEQAIVNSIDGYDIDIEASSHMYFESDDTSATYINHELDNNKEGFVEVRIVHIDEESIILTVGANVEVEVNAYFDFSVRDSIDKDYINMGGNFCTTTETYHTDILLTLTGDFSHDFEDIEVTKIEVLETITHADFEEVEPDWRRDQEDEGC